MDDVVQRLARTHAEQTHDAYPDLPPGSLWNTAYELWWHGPMYEAEAQGVDLDDEAENAFIDAFVARFEELRAEGAGTCTWRAPELLALRQRLVAAGIDETRLAQLDAFVGASGADHDPGALDRSAFTQLMAHAHGLGDAPPKRWRPDVWLDPGWASLFGPVEAWNDVEQRLAAWMLRLPKKPAESARELLYGLPVEAIVEQPAAEVYPAFRAVLLAAGEDPDLCTRRSMSGFLYAALAGSEPTSLGRFLLALPFDRTFRTAVEAQRFSDYAALVLTAEPSLYEAHAAAFERAAATRPVWRVDLAALLLARDPERYLPLARAWFDALDEPVLRCHMLIYLAALDPDPDHVLPAVEQTLRALGTHDVAASDRQRADPDMAEVAGFPNSSAKLCLVVATLRAFGPRALDAVRPFACRSPGWEIRFYTLVARWLPGDPGAAALLVDGLAADLSDHLGGLLTRKRYFSELCAALAGYDLTPHEAAIRSAAARLPPDARPFVEALLR